MKPVLKILRRTLPFWILAGGIVFFYFLVATKPQAQRRAPPEPVIQVEAMRMEPRDFTIMLDSQGTVSARTESTLIPEVSGKIIKVAPNFREGGFFEEGDLLLQIDPSDYETALTIAEANLAEARVRLAEEEAQADQATRDWERLGAGDSPSELVLRRPQLALARANVAAAKARLDEARRNLEDTRITAPYEGRVLEQHVDIGQVVSPGTMLAEIYAVDYAEIRLPLTIEEYAFLNLPPTIRGAEKEPYALPVTLQARFGTEEVSWKGRIVRVEGAIDTRSRQIFVVAQVDDPYGPAHPQPLKVGLFVEARIQGTTLQDVYILPRTALREARYVLTIDDEDRIFRVPVDPLWSNADVVVFREQSIAPGTLAAITRIPLAIDGMHVQPTPVEEP
ncbi:MAG: efflux RND transporter periplasmic adaptor subunit [Oceanipulchritudo sp.]